MKYWLVVGVATWDKLLVAADIIRFIDRNALFESKEGDLVLALNDRQWSSVQPITEELFNKSREPKLEQKEE